MRKFSASILQTVAKLECDRGLQRALVPEAMRAAKFVNLIAVDFFDQVAREENRLWVQSSARRFRL
jgi:hypothetical protein